MEAAWVYKANWNRSIKRKSGYDQLSKHMAKDVLIAGAGPVGLVMAIELARYGVAVRIIDKAPQRTDKSKALVIWSRSLDKLARAGCSAGLVDAGYKVYSVNISAEGKSIARFTSSRPSANLMIPAVCGSSARTDIPPARRREGSGCGYRLPRPHHTKLIACVIPTTVGLLK
jgi:hypothetical protein